VPLFSRSASLGVRNSPYTRKDRVPRGGHQGCDVFLTDLLDVVVGESAAILKLLAGEDQTLLVWRDSLLVLNLGLDVVDGVRRLHLKGDSLTRQGLHEAVGGRVSSGAKSVEFRIGWDGIAYICTMSSYTLVFHGIKTRDFSGTIGTARYTYS
jgi:hypothetical protein